MRHSSTIGSYIQAHALYNMQVGFPIQCVSPTEGAGQRVWESIRQQVESCEKDQLLEVSWPPC